MLKRLLPPLSNRKGVAIEMAILVMVVMFSFSILITTTALLHHDKKIKAESGLERTVVLEQIAYDFCAAAGSGNHSWTSQYPDYHIVVNGLTLVVKEQDAETVLLCVTLQRHGDTYRISAWEAQ